MIINQQEITNVAVIGLGLTGRSCMRFLLAQGVNVTLYDTRANFDKSVLGQEAKNCEVLLGELDGIALSRHQMLLVSPGIATGQPAICCARDAGVLIWGDIELFAHFVDVPVIGITGSNGKTTVTTLLTEMANNAGVNALAIGNIGEPALDHVNDPEIKLFVAELSSFQLETTYDLALCAATVLNVTDDHMDRYDGLEDYAMAKQRIYHHSDIAITNRQDQLTSPDESRQCISFGLDKPAAPHHHYYLADGAIYRGDECLIQCSDIAMVGQHNYLNAMAALALGEQAGLALTPMLKTLQTFDGLAHRCALVPSNDGITWLNDSKATNVGATLAALAGFGTQQGKLRLIVGGDAKGGDLAPLAAPLIQKVAQLVAIGRDKELFADVYPSVQFADTLIDAVNLVSSQASEGDTVLLSPACASIDMFDNYMARGQAFIDAVGELNVK